MLSAEPAIDARRTGRASVLWKKGKKKKKRRADGLCTVEVYSRGGGGRTSM